MTKRFLTLLLFTFSLTLSAQEAGMADTFRQEGKIYVVIGVMSIVFLSIVVYMIIIERRVKKLEEELKEKK
jgi:hypothetical protein